MQEINRLSSAFSIGVIKLNLINPDNSEIIAPARRKEALDGETMNKLFNINRDFREFVQTVLKSININQKVHHGLDKVPSKSDLENLIKEAENTDGEKIEVNDIEYDKGEGMKLDSNFTGKSPIAIKLEDDKIEVSTWKELYLEVCSYLINKDKSIFLELPNKIKGKKRDYFSRNEDDLRVPVYLKDVDIYVEVNLSANNIISNVRKLLGEYKIDENSTLVYINESN